MKNNTQKRKRLVLSRTTIKILDAANLVMVNGGHQRDDDGDGGSGKSKIPCVWRGELQDRDGAAGIDGSR